MNLRQYESTKFDLAEILRAASPGPEAADPGSRTRVAELFAHLADDRFNIVVAGRFSRGKTTLMNAILGMDRLPTGMLPLTSVITRVVYGSCERVQIEFEGGAIPFEIPMEALPEYVTERGNPGNTRRIRAATVALPAELLRRGVCFIDTPGLASAIQQNSRTTEEFLPQADALIMVSGYDGPLTGEELHLAELLSRTNRSLFVVLNKADLVSPEARREADEYVRDRLSEACGADVSSIFSLSAREGLTAKLGGDTVALAASGLERFEHALMRFLLDEKSAAFLRLMCDRIAQLVSTLDASDDVAQLRSRLAVLRARLHSGGENLALHTIDGSRSPQLKSGFAAGARTDSPATEGLSVRIDQCGICARVIAALFEFLRRYQSDLLLDRSEREHLASSGGLCARHLWLYASIASDHDICVTLVPLARHLSAMLHAAGSRSLGAESSLPVGLRPSARVPGTSAVGEQVAECPLCTVESEAELRAMDELAREWQHREGAEPASDAAVPQAPSVCLVHLRMLASQSHGERLTRALALRHGAAVERLVEDMQRYALKREGLRGGLASAEEATAARRAVRFIAGHRTLTGPGRAT